MGCCAAAGVYNLRGAAKQQRFIDAGRMQGVKRITKTL